MSKHDDDTCPHLVRASLIEAENAQLKAEVERLRKLFADTERLMLLDGEYEAAKVGTYARLKADVVELADAIKLASEVGIKVAEEVTRLKAEVERLRKVTDVMSDAIDIYRGWVRLPGDGPFREHLNMIIELMQAKDEWNAAQIAAKEGKPSETKSPSFIEDLGNGVEKHDLLFRYPAKEGKPSV